MYVSLSRLTGQAGKAGKADVLVAAEVVVANLAKLHCQLRLEASYDWCMFWHFSKVCVLLGVSLHVARVDLMRAAVR